MEGANIVIHSRLWMQLTMEDHSRLETGKRISSFSIFGKQALVFRGNQRKDPGFYFMGEFQIFEVLSKSAYCLVAKEITHSKFHAPFRRARNDLQAADGITA